MEKPKTQREVRKEEFEKHAQTARDLADLSLREIDSALKDEADLLEKLQVGVDFGNITEAERDEFLSAYHKTRFGGDSTETTPAQGV